MRNIGPSQCSRFAVRRTLRCGWLLGTLDIALLLALSYAGSVEWKPRRNQHLQIDLRCQRGVLALASLSQSTQLVSQLWHMAHSESLEKQRTPLVNDWSWWICQGRVSTWVTAEGDQDSDLVVIRSWRSVSLSLSLWFILVIFLVGQLVLLYPRLQAWQRGKHGLCMNCGYSLVGNVSGVCPECGTPIRQFTTARPGT